MVTLNSLESIKIFAESYNSTTSISGVLSHQYITNCEDLSFVSNFLFGIVGAYLALITMWVLAIWGIYDEQFQVL